MWKDRRLKGISLKAISGPAAKWEEVNLSEQQFEDIDVREDEKVLRKNIVMTVTFTIQEQGKKEILYSGESIVSSAFNRVAEPYSNYVSENDTKERIALLLAQDLQRQFVLFKNNQLKINER